MSSRLALVALMILPLAACEGTGFNLNPDAQAEAPATPRAPAVSPLEQPIETGGGSRPVSTAERVTYNTQAFTARGNEPFWSVDVAGSTAIYKTPENQRGQAIRVERLTFAKGVEYIGVRGGRPFALNIRGTECRDSMSGERFPMTAVLTTGGKREEGCAGPASAEVAQAVAATRAPAPAQPKAATPKRRSAPKPAARPAAAPAAASTAAASTAAATASTATESPAESSTPAATPATQDSTTATPATTKPSVPAPTMVLPATPPTTTPATTGAESGEAAE